jgi:hypothetical protein
VKRWQIILIISLPLLSGCSSSNRFTVPSKTTLRPTPTTLKSATTSPNSVKHPAHIMLIVLENRESNEIIGASQAPFFNELAAKYGFAAQSFGRTHPSLPNYLELISGTTFGITSDCESCQVTGDNLATQLQSAGIAWGAYFQNMPYRCYLEDSYQGLYAKKHNPFIYFKNLSEQSDMCDNLQPYGNLLSQIANSSAPDFIWVTPNLCNDGHDCPNAAIDSFLSSFVPTVMKSTWFANNAAIIITFDEGASDLGCCRYADGGHIATIVISSEIHKHLISNTPVDTPGILSSIESVYNLPKLNEANNPASGNISNLLANI